TGVLTVENRLKVRLGERVVDKDLHGRIEAAFVDDPLIDPGKVNAAVNDGTVRLYGTVDDYYDKGRVENVVAQIDGVTEIINNLTVENPSRPDTFDPYIDPWPTQVYPWYDYEPGVSYADDPQIRKDVRNQLWWSPYVDADEVTVTVEDGIATLTGTVDSMAERRAAAENAFQAGATWVVNELEVAADAS
ncbi:MAG TPA: BON domain-containing protein, partial [Chromatiales bacterium]|nr:BON domain-containing protein [Chromatiales bacterium]